MKRDALRWAADRKGPPTLFPKDRSARTSATAGDAGGGRLAVALAARGRGLGPLRGPAFPARLDETSRGRRAERPSCWRRRSPLVVHRRLALAEAPARGRDGPGLLLLRRGRWRGALVGAVGAAPPRGSAPPLAGLAMAPIPSAMTVIAASVHRRRGRADRRRRRWLRSRSGTAEPRRILRADRPPSCAGPGLGAGLAVARPGWSCRRSSTVGLFPREQDARGLRPARSLHEPHECGVRREGTCNLQE